MDAAAADGGGAVCPARRLRQRPAAERAAYTAAAAARDSSSDDEHDSDGSESDCSALDNMPDTPEQSSSDDDMSEEEEGQEEAAGAAPGRGRGGAQQQAGTSNTQRSKRRRTSSNNDSSQVPKRQKTSSSAKGGGKIYSHAVEVLPGGNRQVHMDEKIKADTCCPSTLRRIHVPNSLVTACFPDLPCEVNLELTVDGQAADLPAPAQVTLTEVKRRGGSTWTRVRCTGVSTVLRSYLGHTVTRMAANTSGQQFTLHLQSPAAVQAAAAAAAAEAATTGWHVHGYKGGGKKTLGTSASSRRVCIPLKLFSSAFPGAPPLPFKVQLSVYKDGCLAGDPVNDVSVTGNNREVLVPVALAPQVLGCEVYQLKAAAPNQLQVHVKSTVPTPAAVGSADTATAVGSDGAAGTAGAGPSAAAAGPPQHGSNARTRSSRRGSAAAPAAATPSGPDSQAGQQQQQAKKKRQRSAAAASATLFRAAPTALPGVVDPVTAGSGPGVMAAPQAAAAAAAGGIGTLGGTVKARAAHQAACAADVPAVQATGMDPKGAQQQQPYDAAVHPCVCFADMSESEVTADDAGGDAGRQQLQDTATQPEQHQWQQQQVALIASQEQKQGSCLAGGEQCGLNNLVTPTAAPGTEAPTHAVAVAAPHAHAATAEQPAPVKTEQAAAADTGQVGLSHSNAGILAVAAVAGETGGVLPLPAASRGLEGFVLQPATANPVPLHEAWVQLLALLDQLQASKQQLKRLQAAMQLLDGLPRDDERRTRFSAHYATVVLWVKRQDVEEVWEAVGVLLDRALEGVGG